MALRTAILLPNRMVSTDLVLNAAMTATEMTLKLIVDSAFIVLVPLILYLRKTMLTVQIRLTERSLLYVHSCARIVVLD